MRHRPTTIHTRRTPGRSPSKGWVEAATRNKAPSGWTQQQREDYIRDREAKPAFTVDSSACDSITNEARRQACLENLRKGRVLRPG